MGYAPYNAIPERNHWLGIATGSLAPHEAPRFGRLRLPQLGAGLSRNGSVKRPDAHRGGIFLRSLQPGHLTLVGICTSRPYRARVGRGAPPRARAPPAGRCPRDVQDDVARHLGLAHCN